MGVGGKEKMVLTAEEMDTILQQTTEATLNLEEEQRRQGVKTGDAKQQQRSVQEDKGLHVMYMKDSGSEEVSFCHTGQLCFGSSVKPHYWCYYVCFMTWI